MLFRSIADEARWLAVLTASLLDTQAEAWGLAALLTLLVVSFKGTGPELPAGTGGAH